MGEIARLGQQPARAFLGILFGQAIAPVREQRNRQPPGCAGGFDDQRLEPVGPPIDLDVEEGRLLDQCLGGGRRDPADERDRDRCQHNENPARHGRSLLDTHWSQEANGRFSAVA